MGDPRPEKVKATSKPSNFRAARLQLRDTKYPAGAREDLFRTKQTLAPDPGQHPLNLSLTVSPARRQPASFYLRGLEGNREPVSAAPCTGTLRRARSEGLGVWDTPRRHSRRGIWGAELLSAQGSEGNMHGWSMDGFVQAGLSVCPICPLSHSGTLALYL